MSANILTTGEALTDIVIRNNAPTIEYPGGSPMNVAVALGRLGNNSHLLTHIGDDERGREIATHLEHSNVKLTAGSISAGETSTAKATIGSDSSATYEFNITWDPKALELPSHIQAMHFSSIAATLLPGAETVREVAKTYQQNALISYDPNVRPTLMGEAATTRQIVEENIKLADLVKASDEDVAWLYGQTDHGDVAAKWLELGAQLVVITLGAKGAVAYSMKHQVEVEGQSVTVADTVGAGDTFSAGLIDALARLELLDASMRHQLGELEAAEISRILQHAALLASITVSRPGANPPWLNEVETKIML